MADVTTIGVLHPGAMGVTVAAAAAGAVLWAGDGRSRATQERARLAGLEDVGDIASLVDRSDIVVSVCPPGAALEVADAVSAAGFAGIYLDANAISPDTSRSIAERFDHYVDGGIVGPPASQAGTTRLYLSGAEASSVAACWAGSALEVRIVDGGPGAASAVKMCFAAWTKGTSALLLAIRALAEAEGVTDDLLDEWRTSMPDLIARSERVASSAGPKAWRFAPEMEEIASSFADAGLPDGFHRAAAEIYRSLAAYKDAEPGPTLTEVIGALGRVATVDAQPVTTTRAEAERPNTSGA